LGAICPFWCSREAERRFCSFLRVSPWRSLPGCSRCIPQQQAGSVYAAYGAVYVSVALVWLRVVDGVPLTFRDLVGAVEVSGLEFGGIGAQLFTG